MPLVQTVIKINGLYYAGEGSDNYESNSIAIGWQDYKDNHISRLIFTDDIEKAHIQEGNRNVKSIINKIFQRIQDKEIDFYTIEIIKL